MFPTYFCTKFTAPPATRSVLFLGWALNTTQCASWIYFGGFKHLAYFCVFNCIPYASVELMFTSQDSHLESQGGVGNWETDQPLGLPGCRTGAVYVLCPGPRGAIFSNQSGAGRLWKQGNHFWAANLCCSGKNSCLILCSVLVLSLPVRVTTLKIICRVRGLSWSPLAIFQSSKSSNWLRLWYWDEGKHGGIPC